MLWLAVQESQKRGAVHYHLAVDRLLSHTALEAAWGQGYVFVTGPAHGGKPGTAAGYLTKYLFKEIDDKRLAGRHSYLRCADLAVWEVEDTFTRSEEELIQLMAAVAELNGWATSYCRGPPVRANPAPRKPESTGADPRGLRTRAAAKRTLDAGGGGAKIARAGGPACSAGGAGFAQRTGGGVRLLYSNQDKKLATAVVVAQDMGHQGRAG